MKNMSIGNIEKPTKEKELSRAMEMLDAMGQENESEGIAWTKKFMDEFDQRQWEENQLKQDKLARSTKYTRMEYYRIVCGMINEELKDMDIPRGYVAMSHFTENGVIVDLADRWGKRWRRAFKPDGTPKIDFNAVVGLLTDIQNTIDGLEYNAQANLKDLGLVLPS
jgi:hypothetical protein